MCGYRIWGLAAGFIGYFLTGIVIGLLRINISPEHARDWGLGVGIAIYVIPLVLPWILNKIHSHMQIYPNTNQAASISLKKEQWITVMNLVESDCRLKGQEWIKWGI